MRVVRTAASKHAALVMTIDPRRIGTPAPRHATTKGAEPLRNPAGVSAGAAPAPFAHHLLPPDARAEGELVGKALIIAVAAVDGPGVVALAALRRVIAICLGARRGVGG